MKKLEKRKNILKEASVLLIALVMALSAVVVAQNPPDKPDPPSGPTEGDINVEYTFCASTTDPDGENIFYQFDWDDGTYSVWLGPYDSGQEAWASHTWSAAGIYCIKVIARDETGDWSDWSDPLCVNIVGTSPPCDIQIGNIYIGTGTGVDLEKIYAQIINTDTSNPIGPISYTLTFTFSPPGYIETKGASGGWTTHSPPSAVISGSTGIIGPDGMEDIWIRVRGSACFELIVTADCAVPKTVHGCAGLTICS